MLQGSQRQHKATQRAGKADIEPFQRAAEGSEWPADSHNLDSLQPVLGMIEIYVEGGGGV